VKKMRAGQVVFVMPERRTRAGDLDTRGGKIASTRIYGVIVVSGSP
jgi:hypothetical protein